MSWFFKSLRRIARPRSSGRSACSLRFAAHIELLESRRLLWTFTVTSLLDHGGGTLRWAIEMANSHAGQDTIAFNLLGSQPILTRGTVPTIDLTSALPAVAGEVLLDGTTQPGG